MIEAKTGLVFRYSYLWAREFDRGEESGRKGRPVCVQVIISSKQAGNLSLLFPITSQPPGARRSVSLPETEAKRVGLRLPAWVVVDEWNEELDLARSFYVDDSKPLGSFSKAFMTRVRDAAIDAIKSRSYRAVRR